MDFDLRATARRAMTENGFLPDFPPEVRREVEALQETAPNGVRDLRGLLWSSIDNRESRDLDQLEVAEQQPYDHIRVSIAIADVDGMVGKDSATDGHAGRSTTSVYAGPFVFPMLPERLSTDLTSLNPGEDRGAVVVEMDVGPGGAVVRHDVYRALVRSRAKLAYDAVGSWLEGGTDLPPEVAAVPGLEEQVRLQDEAARRLRALRRRHGLLDLDTIEARPVVAGDKVIDLEVPVHDRARDIIENFMIAANVAMARFLKGRRVSSLRRVVRVPKRWDRIVELAAELGESLPAEPDPKALASFLARRKAADPEHHPDLSLAVVKLLGPGEYVLERRFARDAERHFGLALAEYAHSTAPNRRYADLVTQRLVKATLEGAASHYTEESLAAIAARCTEREDAARKVERTVRKSVAAALMQDRIGDRFTAIVTGASEKGTYVRVLRPPIEGRVVRGYQGLDVGDTVRVKLIGAYPEQGFIDFEGPETDVGRKIARSRQKKKAAALLARRIGRQFAAVVTAASPKGTWVRLLTEAGEGRVVRGQRALRVGQTVRVTLVSADAVHGFIDFEYGPGVEARKSERTARKKAMAWRLRGRVGDAFTGVVTSSNPRATYVRVEDPEAEGRIVRGAGGLQVGEKVRVVLLAADPKRGFIDFATELEGAAPHPPDPLPPRRE
jgi:exoribonuclease R